MPSHIRLIGIYANGALAVAFGLIALLIVASVGILSALFCVAVAALGAFNVYVIRTAAMMSSEEEWLKAEIRKAELRKKLEAYDPLVPATGSAEKRT